uniref:Uncharacterized protein n=1 Tax=uncultured Armatimonadetes bacterium TaxID=157466 RepID=A0A6J4K803_9BACT|nr:hypothetical protein AVDCRST_MAG63-4938 [uncultured Armatimonadetes bacterium]
MEQGQVALDAGEVGGVPDARGVGFGGLAQALDPLAVLARLLHLFDPLLRLLTQRFGSAGDVLARESDLVRGDERDRRDLADRALGFPVERADRLDVVAEQVDAHGLFAVRREHVEDVAAAGERTREVDLVLALVAERRQSRRQGVEADRLALRQRDAPRLDRAGRGRLLQDGGDGRDDRRFLAVRERRQRGQAPPGPAHVAPALLVVQQQRQRRRQKARRLLGGQKRAQVLRQPGGLFLGIGDDQERLVQVPLQARQQEPFGGQRHPFEQDRPTTPPQGILHLRQGLPAVRERQKLCQIHKATRRERPPHVSAPPSLYPAGGAHANLRQTLPEKLSGRRGARRR